MPHVINCLSRSRGDGFIQTSFAGAWKCTLEPDLSPKLEPIFRQLSCPPFQLISTSSRHLCSVVSSGPSSDAPVLFLRVQSLSSSADVPLGADIAFAAGMEATCRDILCFIRKQHSLSARASVWRLRDSLDGNIAKPALCRSDFFDWRVWSLLPENMRVADALCGAQCVFFAVAIVVTPPPAEIPDTPPPVGPKRRTTNPQRETNTTTETETDEEEEEEEGEEMTETETETETEGAQRSLEKAFAEARQPTYAEILLRPVPPVYTFDAFSRDVTRLGAQLRAVTSPHEAVAIARAHITRDVCPGGAMRKLFDASAREALCAALIDAAALRVISGASATAELSECCAVAESFFADNSDETLPAGAEMFFAVLRVCAARHRGVAAALAGRETAAAVLKEAQRAAEVICARTETNARGESEAKTETDARGGSEAKTETDAQTEFETRETDARAGVETSAGVYRWAAALRTASLALLEISLLVRCRHRLRGKMVRTAAVFLLRSRAALPVAAALSLEVAAQRCGPRAKQLRETMQQCGETHTERETHAQCGVAARAVESAAEFDQRFARTRALLQRIQLPDSH